MLGTYYKTIERNEYTGETSFLFVPSESTDHMKNGLISCVGKIGVYAYKMPLQLEGRFAEDIFYVDKEYLPSGNKKQTVKFLEYLAPDLSTSKMESIANECQGDIFAFVKEKNCEERLLKILNTCKQKEVLAKSIIRKVKGFLEKEELTRILMKYGISADRIEVLHKKEVSIRMLKENPYLDCLFSDISIYAAEAIAKDLCDIKPYSPVRIIGFIYDAIILSRKCGNTCIPIDKISKIINSRIRKSLFPEAKFSLSIINYGLSFMQSFASIHIVNGTPYVYENHIWEEETSVVTNIKRLSMSKTKLDYDTQISDIETSAGIKYNSGQISATKLLKTSGVKILTGPPGSGKTATIQLLIRCFKKIYPNKNVRLAATTGRATQVMSMACQTDAQTVNKMLDVRPYDGGVSKKTLANPIKGDFIIVDEVSMLGLQLCSFLLGAVQSGSILLLVGDEDQLQSVEYGNVLQDMIESGVVEVYRLMEVMRQSGTICENAREINRGGIHLKQDNTFHVKEFKSVSDAKQQLICDITPTNFQVLSSVKRGILGTYNLNEDIKKTLPNTIQCLKYGSVTYGQNDKIIMLQTNYDKGYFNGDIGTILGNGDKENTLMVDFSGKILCLEKSDFYYMALAYAITAHKSQGSEFDNVHILLPDEPKNMLTRRILYTAVTRAKKEVYIYSVNNSITYAIGNNGETKRITMLDQRLKQ